MAMGIPCDLQFVISGFNNLVKIKGALERPKSKINHLIILSIKSGTLKGTIPSNSKFSLSNKDTSGQT